MNLFFQELWKTQKKKKTFLCVGLDPHPDKMPSTLKGKPEKVIDFLKTIVDATQEYTCCYKPQIAYYSAFGLESTLQEIISYIQTRYPDTPVILDAKRNDIGSTAQMYALEAFERYKADALTVNPYMGGDSIEPFARYKDKGIFVLCRTSNEGASELQNLKMENKLPLYSVVADHVLNSWDSHQNLGLVVGATAIDELRKIRNNFPTAWFLVPGIGEQGGSLAAVIEYGRRHDDGGGLVINAARSILYASTGNDFGEKAAKVAMGLQKEMAKSLS